MAKTGQLIRFDDNVWPTMYRCATVTRAELDQLRRIKQVIRMGRVSRIEADEIILDEGSVPTDNRTLHVDCSADGLEQRPAVPVFSSNSITLQSVRTCQQVFSAAFIGHVEAAYSDEATKNELCTPVPHPDSDVDFLRTALANNLNAARWAADPELQAWLQQARLDGFTNGTDQHDMDNAEVAAAFAELRELSMRATENLQVLLSE